MNRINCLIFDLDGTLIDSSKGVVDAVNYALAELNQPPQSAEAIKPFIGYSLDVMFPHFTDRPLKELRRLFQVRAAATMVRSTVALDGVAEVLHRLRDRGYRLAIASTKIRIHIDGILTHLGWSELFQAVTGGDEVGSVKPAPEAFELTLERLGRDPAASLAVGDTENDILAAHAVPMQAVGVMSPYGGRERLLRAEPDYVIETVSQLPHLLIEMEQSEER